MAIGTCTYKCKVEKDVLFPNEMIKLEISIDNTNCTKSVDYFKIKLLKRTQAFDIETKKPVYTNDFILCSEKLESKCEAKSTETTNFEF